MLTTPSVFAEKLGGRSQQAPAPYPAALARNHSWRMNRWAGGKATLGPTEELMMGFISWFMDRGSDFRPRWLRRWIVPTGRPDPKLDEIKRAAAADAAAMEAEDRKYFRQDGPGKDEDLL